MLGEERMKVIEYKSLEWYIINETNKEKLLFLRDSFSYEQVLKYFTDKSMVDKYYDVQFSKKISSWFIDSYIREILNSSFLSILDKNDLNIMKTTLELNGETKISEDYVRLITKEEVEKLPKEILKTEREFGYWTMSPYRFSGSSALVFDVSGSSNPGYLSVNSVNNTNAVRPVISLKPESLKSEVSLENEEIKRAILKFKKYTKC